MKIWETLPPKRKKKKKLNKKEAIKVLDEVGEIIRREIEFVKKQYEKFGDWEDYDITVCEECGELIVVDVGEMEYPTCHRLRCIYKYLKRNNT